MKDIVANRQKIALRKKLKVGSALLRENGILWTLYLVAYYAASSAADMAFRRMHERALKFGLPGMSSPTSNRTIWDRWNWEHGGNEWTLSEEWKDSFQRCVLHKYMPVGKNVLEIGPGAGRWTELLQPIAASLVGVDISEKCVELCREKFGRAGNTRFISTTGNTLSGVEDRSVDAIWSFDVFVHINTSEAAGYVWEFRRVLRPGGVGVVHHGKQPEIGGWRSDLTAEKFKALLEGQGLIVVEQFQSWEDNGKTMPVGRYEDFVTVFRN